MLFTNSTHSSLLLLGSLFPPQFISLITTSPGLIGAGVGVGNSAEAVKVLPEEAAESDK
ncbi:MAG: hypothetical protein UY33_C0032G0033 [Candidatus Amesbacteria bacterium GW2011_GWA1_48_9]|uniref:Uncharacterized protein n=1 Tax=Candidatus Amesbacteria bacterium GW2011_GWA1_48_9 TaxID=1618355 RepID=A0A0G1UYV6_9BACT|nr:MAG: hypothetical protein UY33_C0032G0033 [Candidatus Amesbacteria bacterium GW2011_GWA1_48_9]